MKIRAKGLTASFRASLVFLLAMSIPAVTTAAPAQVGDAASRAAGLLSEVAGYEYGDDRAPLSALRELVGSVLDRPADRRAVERTLVTFLASDASFAARQFVCEQLGIVGSAAAVPILSELLETPDTVDIALSALQRIPGPEAGNALREALSGADLHTSVAVANSLGARRDAAAIGALAALLDSPETSLAEAAARALGKIPDLDAVTALAIRRETSSGSLREIVLDAYLRQADALAANGDAVRAAGIYEDVYAKETDDAARAAALRGLVLVVPDSAPERLRNALLRDNATLQGVAAALVRVLPEGTELDALLVAESELPAMTRVRLYDALADRRERAAYETVLRGTRHHDDDVRAAAIRALAALGSAADVPMLAATAADGRTESDRTAARAALDSLRGTGVNDAIIEGIGSAGPAVKAELARTLGARNAVDSVGLLLEVAADPEPAVRSESFRSLGVVAGPEQVSALLSLLVAEENDGVRAEAERSVVALIRKNRAGADLAGPVLDVLPDVEGATARASLIAVLGRVGDPSALPVLRHELASDEPGRSREAILALSSWPDDEPREDLLAIAEESESPVHRVLALRSYIDLLRLPNERPAAETVELLLGAMELATELTERRMVLSGLGATRALPALFAAVPYLDDPELAAEAEAACAAILSGSINADPESFGGVLEQGLGEALEEIAATSEDERLLDLVTRFRERIEQDHERP